MLSNFKGLGEHTLSKIAEAALASQLKAEKLKITVKTNPEKLSKGIVESLCIDGEGLIISSNNQRFQNLRMTFEQISVSPLQALVGKIKLTRPSQGTAFFVLSNKDLEQRLNAVKPNNIKTINCSITPDGDLILHLVSQSHHQDSHVQLRPRLCGNTHRVFLEKIDLHNHNNNLSDRFLKEAEGLFNLKSFQLKGFSLKINSLAVNKDNFTVQAATEISNFPQAV